MDDMLQWIVSAQITAKKQRQVCGPVYTGKWHDI